MPLTCSNLSVFFKYLSCNSNSLFFTLLFYNQITVASKIHWMEKRISKRVVIFNPGYQARGFLTLSFRGSTKFSRQNFYGVWSYFSMKKIYVKPLINIWKRKRQHLRLRTQYALSVCIHECLYLDGGTKPFHWKMVRYENFFNIQIGICNFLWLYDIILQLGTHPGLKMNTS